MTPVVAVKRVHASRKRREQFHHGDLAAAAIAVATDEIERHGHLHLSLRAVAHRLGVTQPALYRHFRSKDALLDEIGLRGFVRFADAIVAPVGGDPFVALAHIGRAYVRFAHGNPGWFRMWFARVNNERYRAPEHRAFVERAWPIGMRIRDRLRSGLAAIVHDEPAIVDDLYRTTWAVAHGLAVFVVDRVFQLVQTDEERLAAADAAIAVYVDALRARWPVNQPSTARRASRTARPR